MLITYTITFLCISLFTSSTNGAVASDLINNLPGLTFNPGFKQYSGFLHVPSGNALHYWLVESQKDPENDPLLLWLNGGPGCSSLGGFFTENGPFRVNPDNKTLFENVFSWNKAANVLYLESPTGVGFSYHNDTVSKPSDILNDDLTAIDNADAIGKFFQLFSEYSGRPFYVTGESYAGVYIPTMVNLLINRIMSGTLINVNLRGAAIGNGALSQYIQMSSVVSLLYYKGIYGIDWYESLRPCCKNLGSEQSLAYCDFAQYVHMDEHGNYLTKPYPDDPIKHECSVKIQQMVSVENTNYTINDAYNTYQDCYSDFTSLPSVRASKVANLLGRLGPSSTDSFINQLSLTNYYSTDSQNGYPCFMATASTAYLNLPEVRKAINIPTFVQPYQECSDYVANHYNIQYMDTMDVFQSIIGSTYPLRILIYNGDTDTVCNLMGDEWFIWNLTMNNNMNASNRTYWMYHQDKLHLPQIAGYYRNFTNSIVNIDLLTVKGSGHFVPLDRAGPALQMIMNFVNEVDYSTNIMTPDSFKAKPLLPQYSTFTVPKTRKELARIWSLPGTTFNYKFNQYSGYLNGVTGNYLHYWLVESQGDPKKDPLVLWLNGGPGCSSLGGFFTENGPFRPNPDAETLFENVYSWNKGANVLFLESPRNVGFSYQNYSESLDPEYNDFKTARDNFLALKDFLTVFPEYIDRPFYIAGESYAGIYIPTLTAYTIEQIQNNNAPGLNLIGIAIGNGELSMYEQLNSIMTQLYYRGTFGYELFKNITDCCTNKNASQPVYYCDFASHTTIIDGIAYPNNATNFCDNLMVQYGWNYIWNEQSIQDVYNMNQDCYETKGKLIGTRMLQLRLNKYIRNMENKIGSKLNKRMKRQAGILKNYDNQQAEINYQSTDALAGFYCYETPALQHYLNNGDVREALHIPEFVPEWVDCSDPVGYNYVQQNPTTKPSFDQIIKSNYPLNILIYNGDVDTACEFLGDEWFVEKLVKEYSMKTLVNWSPWYHLSQVAGYQKRFEYSKVKLDFLTVKGSGHFVPMDRPGPALQMITNFISRKNYSTIYPYDTTLAQLTQQYKILEQVVPLSQPQKAEQKFDETLTTLLPDISFVPDFNQSTGYLSTGEARSLVFYWLISSRHLIKPINAPETLVVWLGGNPGCSAVADIFQDMGPYRLIYNQSKMHLDQNPYSWNQAADFLFIESPLGVGYSNATVASQSDTSSAQMNFKALQDFFTKETAYNKYTLYIGGEGYGVVSAMMLAKQLIASKDLKGRFGGLILENGMFSRKEQINSLPDLMYFSALMGKEEWDKLIPCCTTNNIYDSNCDLSKYVTINDQGVVVAQDAANKCGLLVAEYANKLPQTIMGINEADNFYGSCYLPIQPKNNIRQKRQAFGFGGLPLTNNYTFINQGGIINYMSTDAFASYPCYMNEAIKNYLNQPEVIRLLNVQPKTIKWQKCNAEVQKLYKMEQKETTDLLKSIVQSGQKMKLLIYGGDAELENNFIANEVFMINFYNEVLLPGGQNPTKSDYMLFNFTQSSKYLISYAGYYKIYSNDNVNIKFVTIKSAGRYVALDRPLPALQMFENFLLDKPLDTAITWMPSQKLIAPSKPSAVNQAEADKIYNLPGLTYAINFEQYAGYLKAKAPGNYLFYWYVQSQRNPSSDPLILWLNGGPGCSSIAGLLNELGPFRPNFDGHTLYENVFSWNKFANILFIDSPRQVGFSYQDKSVNKDDGTWTDNETIADAFEALLNFIKVYPSLENRELYIAGESYASVYVPILAEKLLQSTEKKPKLVGIIVGNGYFSQKQYIDSLPQYLYFHGIFGKTSYDTLMNNCCKNDTADKLPKFKCDFSQYVQTDTKGTITPVATVKPEICGQLIAKYVYNWIEKTQLDSYNLYQSCYQNDHPFANNQLNQQFQQFKSTDFAQQLRPNFALTKSFLVEEVNTYSTDQYGGFACFMIPKTVKYLSWTHVRQSLHIPDYVPAWSYCSKKVAESYTWPTNYDGTESFKSLIKSGNGKLKMLIYNGDVDPTHGILEAQWFFDNFAKETSPTMTKEERKPWYYQISGKLPKQIGGYNQKLDNAKATINVVTVKGSGLFVPTDRSGPIAQLVYNFISDRELSSLLPFLPEPSPLLPEYQSNETVILFTTTSSSPLSSSTTSTPLSSSTTSTPLSSSTTSTPLSSSTTSIPKSTVISAGTGNTTITPKIKTTTHKAASYQYASVINFALLLFILNASNRF